MEFCVLFRRIIVVAVLFVAIVSSASVEDSKFKRVVSGETKASMDEGPKVCHSRIPCGWAVYNPLTRNADYFMTNTCVCSKGKVCLRTDDDISVSAYVYRCRVEANPDEPDMEPT